MSCGSVNININSIEAMNVINYCKIDVNPDEVFDTWQGKYRFRQQINPSPIQCDVDDDGYVEGINYDDEPFENPEAIEDITDDELSYAANILDETPDEVYALYTGYPHHDFYDYVNNTIPYDDIDIVDGYSLGIYDDIEPNRDPDDE